MQRQELQDGSGDRGRDRELGAHRVKRGFNTDRQPFQGDGGHDGNRKLARRTEEDEIERGWHPLTCRERLDRLLSDEEGELDAEENRQEAHERRPTADDDDRAPRHEPRSPDEKEAAKDQRSHDAEARLGESGEVGVSPLTLYGLSRSTELELVRDQVARLGQQGAEGEQPKEPDGRPVHVRIIPIEVTASRPERGRYRAGLGPAPRRRFRECQRPGRLVATVWPETLVAAATGTVR